MGRRVRTQRCAIKAGTMTARAPASSLKLGWALPDVVFISTCGI